MTRLEKTALIIGYSVIALGMWAMPALALKSTADASIGSKLLCVQGSELVEEVVSIHDEFGLSVLQIEAAIFPGGNDTMIGKYMVALARNAVINDAPREGLREAAWRQCLEDLN